MQRTSSNTSTSAARKLNKNSFESSSSSFSFNMNQANNNNKIVTNQEDEHSTSASESNDLDDYATTNECNLIKRSNPVRISRKLALNRIIAHSHSNVNTNLSHQNLVEASYLLDFLNKGLEENRELPLNSNSRSNSNTVSNVELNKNETTAIKTHGI